MVVPRGTTMIHTVEPCFKVYKLWYNCRGASMMQPLYHGRRTIVQPSLIHHGTVQPCTMVNEPWFDYTVEPWLYYCSCTMVDVIVDLLYWSVVK